MSIGALLGGVAGNRIAGRGDRTEGTLVGAGIGCLLGVAVEKAGNKCQQYHPDHSRPPLAYARPYPRHSFGSGWQGGYYHYPQAPMVAVTVIPGASTTTTVTNEVYYETVRVAARNKAVRT